MSTDNSNDTNTSTNSARLYDVVFNDAKGNMYSTVIEATSEEEAQYRLQCLKQTGTLTGLILKERGSTPSWGKFWEPKK